MQLAGWGHECQCAYIWLVSFEGCFTCPCKERVRKCKVITIVCTICYKKLHTQYAFPTFVFLLQVLVWAELAHSLLLMQWCRDWRRKMISTSTTLWLRWGPNGLSWSKTWYVCNSYACRIRLYSIVCRCIHLPLSACEYTFTASLFPCLIFLFRSSMPSSMMPSMTTCAVETLLWLPMNSGQSSLICRKRTHKPVAQDLSSSLRWSALMLIWH